MTPYKLKTLTIKQQHKHAARIIREILEENKDASSYLLLAPLFSLSPPRTLKQWCDRFHFHYKLAHEHISETSLLQVRTCDRLSGANYLTIDIYLDHLRSAHNVGSILRTNEAFRIGEVYFGGYTPTDPIKIHKTSMGSVQHVVCHQNASYETLTKRPLIALETVDGAIDLESFIFPSSFTLILGNEETGISDQGLSLSTQFIQIPLVGMKNSINVAAAFAIVAAKIRHQHSISE